MSFRNQLRPAHVSNERSNSVEFVAPVDQGVAHLQLSNKGQPPKEHDQKRMANEAVKHIDAGEPMAGSTSYCVWHTQRRTIQWNMILPAGRVVFGSTSVTSARF